jgi:hypothetical protein
VSAAAEWAVPPGYRRLADFVQEHGRDHVQTKLVSGQWSAFEFDIDTGDLRPIPTIIWCATRGRWLLERAENPSDRDGYAILTDTNHWVVVIVQMIPDQPPPKTVDQKDTRQPQVSRAKTLMDVVYSNGEWRSMMIKVVRNGCAGEAQRRGWRLPSPDSFSIAMGRRRRR